MSVRFDLNDFIAFKHFISRALIIIVYVIGVLFITVGSFLMMIPKRDSLFGSTFSYGNTSGSQIFLGLLGILVGNLIWRIICEAGIVIFSMQDDLTKIRKSLEEKKL
jgi:hypothetical protein